MLTGYCLPNNTLAGHPNISDRFNISRENVVFDQSGSCPSNMSENNKVKRFHFESFKI